MTEFELKFQVPDAGVERVEAALRREATQELQLQALYFDTADGALQRIGAVLRLRQEGEAWVQTAKAPGRGHFERLEHNVPLPAGSTPQLPDAALHAGTPVGDCLREALAEDAVLVEVHRMNVRRVLRTVTAGPLVAELAWDRGEIAAGGHLHRVQELEFELKAGSPADLVAFAAPWCEELGLWLDPVSKSQQAQRLLQGRASAPALKAVPPQLAKDARAREAFASCLAASLAQVLANARELAAGVGDAEHVHQLRVGLRRLRTVLRELAGLAPAGTPRGLPAVDALFRLLGQVRDGLSVAPAVQRELEAVGGPQLDWPQGDSLAQAGAAVRAAPLQRALLDILVLVHHDTAEHPRGGKARKAVATRLQRLWKRSQGPGRNFLVLGEEERHAVRKTSKRLRDLGELTQGLFAPRGSRRFLEGMKELQDDLGAYQDAVASQALWRQRAVDDMRALFGQGWLLARSEMLAVECQAALRKAGKDLQPYW